MIALAAFVIVLGAVLLVSALQNWDWFNAIHEFAFIEGLLGENASRWMCGGCGIVLIGLGLVWLIGQL